jgi:pyrroloquinoline quinone biosynthesis protein E
MKAEKIAKRYQEKYKGETNFYFVIPDYFENRPKPCMNGWGRVFMNITPDGAALPCHSARVIPDIEFPNVRDHSIKWIWGESSAFNHFRGYDWMKEPCRSCPERFKDYGGCRCQAYLLTGDARNTDPVCDLSPNHHIVLNAIKDAQQVDPQDKFVVFRNPKNSRDISKKGSG